MIYHFEKANLCRQLETVIDYIRWSVSVFNSTDVYFGHGTDNAWDEAVALVLQALSLPHDCDPRIMTARLLEDEKHKIIGWIEKRVVEHKPLPYIAGRAWFANLEFYVDDRVLIPRSPIAELIDNQFEPHIDIDKMSRILELCTGSACIAVALAIHFPEVQITATDISQDALVVAKSNIDKHDMSDRIELILTDLFPPIGDKYDLIIANPPYVTQEEMRLLPAEYQCEPALALVAGDKGLDIVHRILKQAKHFLTEEGALICEVGATQDLLMEAYPDLPFIWLSFEKSEDGVFLLYAADLASF